MKRMLVWIALLAAIAFSGILVKEASGQQPTPPVTDDQVNAVARQLYCPVCENIPLDVCPTTACANWRALIRQKLEIGWTNQQIRDYFALQYGDRVLSTIPAKGFNWLVYALPPVFIIGGVIILALVIRRARKPQRRTVVRVRDSENGELGDQYIREIEAEVERRTRE